MPNNDNRAKSYSLVDRRGLLRQLFGIVTQGSRLPPALGAAPAGCGGGDL
jgi:hypothetical protein